MADADFTVRDIHSREFKRVLPVIVALERIERPTVVGLASSTGLTERELESRFKQLQSNYQVVIERSRNDGCLTVKNWGIIVRHQSSSQEV
ncbi:hypothetical protein EUZ85_30010 [Hahella sp. KA22]|uniref:hypothetical protein n=1 Tax=Hahella sp. KA22 TaxID=1628392 RepID=UPI000FDDF5C0|nr:hypothetical protein [Hahella sp. KA22]AZZ94719.1 hypothetical protein ENC22_27425 [Hahella sp. KA22]QAY58093.1 hypothetical protein EUZ85_30010 [Hahella sp. KA22]